MVEWDEGERRQERRIIAGDIDLVPRLVCTADD